MSYLENSLIDDEQLIYRARLHWIIFLLPAVFSLIVFMLFITDDISNNETSLLFAVIVLWLYSFIYFKTSEFGITNKRVLFKTGFIRRNSLEFFLTQVEAIEINQGIFGRLLNYGAVIVKGSGGSANSFFRIDNPLEFRKKTQEQIILSQEKK
ncbi:MAG: PH domain-containing protein [Patescibacteria group bacterium]|jgi:uncharacterized membrane protein YdbT with pleckstrin-like domain|nr:PH domain-containing protein [Patescibacteria group bacterium]MDD5172642.1 PH domain-containing protein [Patescibacteria group bacterium]